MSLLKDRKVLSWAAYDWANSAFATTVLAGFFPVFLKDYWSAGAAATETTFWLGAANSGASLIVALLAPVLGAIADRGGRRKRFLITFTYLGVLMTAALAMVAKGDWPMALAVFMLGNIGFAGANIFYDALVVDVSPPDKLDRVSALGYAAGYLGGGLLFAVNVAMVLKPATFGLMDAAEAVQVSFLTVAVWWALFTVPLMLYVHEHDEGMGESGWAMARAGWGQLIETFDHLRQLRMVFLFLLAYWLYIDGVYTAIKMAVDYGLALGFPSSSLITALLMVQFIGFPAALAFGYIGERIGAKRGISIGITVYLLVTLWAAQMSSLWEFYAMAAIIGLVQGGVQALSRSLYARLIPAAKSGEFFGFFNMLGKFAAILGPLLVGTTALLTESPRGGILSLVVLFLLGLWLLRKVDVAEGERMAKDL